MNYIYDHEFQNMLSRQVATTLLKHCIWMFWPFFNVSDMIK